MRLDYIFIFFFFIALLYLVGKTNAKLYQTPVKQEIINWSISFIIFFSLFLAFFGLLFLPANIIHNLFFESCTIGYNKAPDMRISLQLNLLAIIIGLAIPWFLANKSENMGTINGIGTKLLGNERTSNGYIATKWLVLLFLPILPVKSYEVSSEQQGAYERIYYSMHPLPQLVKSQIKETFKKSFLWYSLVALFVAGITMLGTWKCF